MANHFIVQIDCGNAAYGETPPEWGAEIARQLRKLADTVQDGQRLADCGGYQGGGCIADYNGNNTLGWSFNGESLAQDMEDEG